MGSVKDALLDSGRGITLDNPMLVENIHQLFAACDNIGDYIKNSIDILDLDEINSLIGESNADGWLVDEFFVTEVHVLPGATCNDGRLSAKVSFTVSGEHDPEKMWHGDTIIGRLQLDIVETPDNAPKLDVSVIEARYAHELEHEQEDDYEPEDEPDYDPEPDHDYPEHDGDYDDEPEYDRDVEPDFDD